MEIYIKYIRWNSKVYYIERKIYELGINENQENKLKIKSVLLFSPKAFSVLGDTIKKMWEESRNKYSLPLFIDRKN